MHLSCLGPASRDLITHILSSLFMVGSGSSSCCQLSSCWTAGIVLPGLRNSRLEGWKTVTSCLLIWQEILHFTLSSVQFSRSVMSDSLRTHELQHTRPPCPSPTPRVYPNPCPSSQWCHPTTSSSVVPFSSCPQTFPASGSFPKSQLFTSGGQNIGVSASTSVLPMNTQDWSPLGWTGWISLQSKGLWRVSQHHSSKASILWHSVFFTV